VQGSSGSNINGSGFYTAGTTTGTDEVTVIDPCNGSISDTAEVQVVTGNDCLADIAPITGVDCKVNLSDLVLMKTEFNRTNCSPSNPCYADIVPAPSGDNKVNLSDLVVMKTEFSRTNCCP
jgi:hypothetical protein